MKRNSAVITMGLAALVIAGTADLFAGILQDQMTGYLFAGMMILIYSAIGMRGNIFGAMGSRIGTALNIGTFEMSLRKGTVLRANIESAILLTFIMSIAMGITTWAAACLMFTDVMSVWDFIFISTVGGVVAGAIVLVFNILIAYVGNKREWDVDNITAPLIAAIGDIVTMPLIFAATWLYLQVEGGMTQSETVMMVCSLIFIVFTIVFSAYIIKRKVSRRDFSGEAKRIVIQSLPILLICLIFEIGAGITIQNQQDSLVSYSVLLIMLPAFLNQGNALSGMLTSRLSSMIHLGTLEEGVLPGHGAYENFGIMYVCAMLTFLYIGIISYIAALITGEGDIGFATALAIIMIAGFLATTILNFLSYYVAIAATKFGLDPDDHCIPITSSVMDLLGSLVLVFVIGFFI